MAATFTPNKDGNAATLHAAGDLWILLGTITFSGSYATGGDVLSLRKYLVGMSTVKSIVLMGTIRGNAVEYDVANDKLKMYASANTEVAAAGYNAALTGSPAPVAFLCK